jgi:hypothetical protein
VSRRAWSQDLHRQQEHGRGREHRHPTPQIEPPALDLDTWAIVRNNAATMNSIVRPTRCSAFDRFWFAAAKSGLGSRSWFDAASAYSIWNMRRRSREPSGRIASGLRVDWIDRSTRSSAAARTSSRGASSGDAAAS